MKLLLVSLKGLGDTVYMIPLIRRLRAEYGGEPMTLVVRDRKCIELFANCPYVRPVLVDYKRAAPADLAGHLGALLALRREKFDACLTAYPSNRLAYNLFAFLSGARLRVTHRYSFASWRTLPFLQQRRVDSPRTLHQVEKNLDLLRGLGLDPAAARPDMSLWLAPADEAFADEQLRAGGAAAGEPLVGVHPSISSSQVYKNWDRGNIGVFAALIDWLWDEYGARALVFAGPDEAEAANSIIARVKRPPLRMAGASTNGMAAVLRRCRLFVNTDSGLGPLAAAAGTPCVTVLGPTDPVVTAPYGPDNIAVTLGAACAPCYTYPYESTEPGLKCDAHACMGVIPLEKLQEAVRRRLGPGKSRR